MHKLTKALVGAAVVGGAVFAAPLAANAADYPPVPDTSSGANPTAAPGTPVTADLGAGILDPNSLVSVSLSSTGPVPSEATVTAATFRAAQSGPFTGTSGASGAVAVNFTVPADATGAINITATDEAGNTATSAVSVAAAGGTGGGSSLATTGTYISLATVWGAVGLVALGGGFIVVRQMNAKRRDGQGAKA